MKQNICQVIFTTNLRRKKVTKIDTNNFKYVAEDFQIFFGHLADQAAQERGMNVVQIKAECKQT